MTPRLFRPQAERLLGGVCAGLGLYFGLDPVIVRLLFVVIALTTGLTLMLYPLLWFIMPNAIDVATLPEDARYDPQTGQPLYPQQSSVAPSEQLPESRSNGHAPRSRNQILALVLVSVGAMIFLDEIGDFLGVDVGTFVVPVLLIGLGFYLLRGTHTRT